MSIANEEASSLDLSPSPPAGLPFKQDVILARLNRARKTVLLVCVLLIASQIMLLLFGLLGFALGIAGAVFTMLVSWYSTRKARQGAKSTIWFMLPPLVFSGIPLILRLLPYRESGLPSMDELLFANLPFVFGFLIPVAILLVLYWRLSSLTLLIGKNRKPHSA